jgi:hypothetical protein
MRQHRPSAAVICGIFRSDCFKYDFLCNAEISGFNVCSNTRECVDFGRYYTRAALVAPMQGWKAIVLKAVVCSDKGCSVRKTLRNVRRRRKTDEFCPCNPLHLSRSTLVNCTVTSLLDVRWLLVASCFPQSTEIRKLV